MQYFEITVIHPEGTEFEVWEELEIFPRVSIEIRQIKKVWTTETILCGPLKYKMS